MRHNPFATRGMIKSESNFWGRKRETDMIYSCLLDSEEQPQSVAVVGQRRIGKSSLLYRVFQKRDADEFYDELLERTVCVMVSMQGLVDCKSDDFYTRILEDLETQEKLPGDIVHTVASTSNNSESKFRKILRLLDRKDWVFVLLIDEFEAAANNSNFDKSFFDKLRAAAQEQRLAFVVATQTDLDKLWNPELISSPYSSPFFNIFYTTYLKGFEPDEVETYLQEFSAKSGRHFCEQETDLIKYIGGTHPFFLNIAAYHVFQAISISQEYSEHLLTQTHEQIIQDRALYANFRYYWQKLTPPQQEILLSVAKGEQIGLSGAELVDLRSLERVGLVAKQSSDGIYAPFSEAFRKYLRSSLLTSQISRPEQNIIDQAISDLISQDEGPELEFKSSLRWDIKKQEIVDYLEHPVLKTLAAFLNTHGGTLIIGLGDEGEVLGLEKDYQSFSRKPNRDGFQLHLMEIIANNLGEQSCQLTGIHFENIDGRDLCLITVRPSSEPVFMSKKKDFFIRRGNSTRELPPDEMVKYCMRHWAVNSE